MSGGCGRPAFRWKVGERMAVLLKRVPTFHRNASRWRPSMKTKDVLRALRESPAQCRLLREWFSGAIFCPEEIWVDPIGVRVHTGGRWVHGHRSQDYASLAPWFIGRWRIRRAVARWRDAGGYVPREITPGLEQICMATPPFIHQPVPHRAPDRVLKDKIVTARVKHEPCHLCGGTVAKGTRNRVRSERLNGVIMVYRWCEPCVIALAMSGEDGGAEMQRRAHLTWSNAG
jgi:hypothetical protein